MVSAEFGGGPVGRGAIGEHGDRGRADVDLDPDQQDRADGLRRLGARCDVVMRC
jgi:hypothetical protein